MKGCGIVRAVEQYSSFVAMDTLVSATFVGNADRKAALDSARRWFAEVERACNRFEPGSEINALVPGRWLRPSSTLFYALALAVNVATASDGAFDPALGRELAERGFDRNYLTGEHTRAVTGDGVWADLELDHDAQRVRLRRPIAFDLGGIAKGLALDLAANDLAELDLDGFALDAGGDVIVRGVNPAGVSWRVGVRDPRRPGRLIATVRLTDQAVCSSGTYHRGRHLLDPLSGVPARPIGATVVAPVAALADALSTAAAVLEPEAAIALLEANDVAGFVVTGHGVVLSTDGLAYLP